MCQVEAESSAPYAWAPGAKGASGATGYFGSLWIVVILKGRFCFGKKESKKGGKAHREVAILDRYKEALHIRRMEERNLCASAFRC